MVQRITFILMSVFLCTNVIAQSQEIKTKQRAIFILNMAQNFQWRLEKPTSDFNLIILGDEELYTEITALSKNRKIDNRNINTLFHKTAKQFINADLIYVNQSYGFSAPRLLKIINQRNILLIGENYQYNECMVNLLSISNNFLYELNSGKLKSHYFTPPKSLINNSISSASKWFDLYKESQLYLETEKDESGKKSLIIANQQKTLEDLENKISALRKKINSLTAEVEKKAYILKNLNSNLAKQREIMSVKLSEITLLENTILESKTNYLIKVAQSDSLNREIERQQKLVELQHKKIFNQDSKIEDQQNILSEQDYELKSHRRLTALLLSVLFLVSFIGYLIVRSYLKEKKLNELLHLKNAEILDRNQEIEQFAYIASHDLQAPVNTIVGFVQLLEFNLKGKLDKDDILNMNFIKESSDRMKRLIKDLLDYSQIGETKSEKFNVNELLNVVLDDLEINPNTAKVKIHIHNPEDVSINGLYTDIRLLFQNLISNSLKFTAPDSSTRIHISIHQKSINKTIKTICSVEDNGIGIEDKYRKDVFDVFKRLHNDTEYDGTGIGLAHCKKIVTRHHGKIWIEDSTLGGSNVCFTLTHLLS